MLKAHRALSTYELITLVQARTRDKITLRTIVPTSTALKTVLGLCGGSFVFAPVTKLIYKAEFSAQLNLHLECYQRRIHSPSAFCTCIDHPSHIRDMLTRLAAVALPRR